MKFSPVSSSNINAVGFDSVTGILGIEFKSGKTYYYTGVGADTHQALIGADSIGKYVRENIIKKYPLINL